MKKIYIFLLIFFILIIFLLILYTVTIAKTPVISRLIKFDGDNVVYKVRNISSVRYCCDVTGGHLQYKEDNRWVYVDSKNNAKLDVLGCLPGLGKGRREFKINLNESYDNLKSGEYRIEKEFYREEKGKNHVTYKLYVYFDI